MDDERPIRLWYQATTRLSRRLVFWGAFVVGPLGLLLYAWLPQTIHAALQVFNGAYTIPAVAALWIYAFVYLFLVPSRESGFRSVESIERSEDLIRRMVEEKLPVYWERDVKPVLTSWQKLGQRLEDRLDESTLDRVIASLEVMVEVNAPVPANTVHGGLGASRKRSPVAAKEETA